MKTSYAGWDVWWTVNAAGDVTVRFSTHGLPPIIVHAQKTSGSLADPRLEALSSVKREAREHGTKYIDLAMALHEESRHLKGTLMWPEDVEAIAAERPEELLRMLRVGSLDSAALSLVAEAAGIAALDQATVLSSLLPLLEHEDSVVRIGTVLGIASLPEKDVVGVLERVAQQDSDASVRAIAAEHASALSTVHP